MSRVSKGIVFNKEWGCGFYVLRLWINKGFWVKDRVKLLDCMWEIGKYIERYRKVDKLIVKFRVW